MKITVVCAGGKEGRLLVKEARDRGHEVTAVVRSSASAPKADKVLVKDLFQLTRGDVRGSDAVIDAFGAWTEETLPQHSTSLKHLCDIVSDTDIRLLVVGGAGSLYVNREHTICLEDGPDFPDAYKPVSKASGDALKELRKRDDVKWTYLSPAADFRAEAPRTGRYTLGGEELILNAKGESVISYADYAVAMIDEAEQGKNIQKRISVVGE